jgi:hypothetical protein
MRDEVPKNEWESLLVGKTIKSIWINDNPPLCLDFTFTDDTRFSLYARPHTPGNAQLKALIRDL